MSSGWTAPASSLYPTHQVVVVVQAVPQNERQGLAAVSVGVKRKAAAAQVVADLRQRRGGGCMASVQTLHHRGQFRGSQQQQHLTFWVTYLPTTHRWDPAR